MIKHSFKHSIDLLAVLTLLCVGLTTGCNTSENTKQEKQVQQPRSNQPPKAKPSRDLPKPSSNVNLPMPVGRFGEVVIVTDSATFAGPVGQLLKDSLQQSLDFLIAPEPMFKIQIMSPENLPDIIKRHRNIIYLVNWAPTTSEGYLMHRFFSDEVKEKLKNEDKFMLMATDKHARGQQIYYLMGKNEATLTQKLKQNATALIQHLWQVDRERMLAELLSERTTKPEVPMLAKAGVGLSLTNKYQKVALEENFVWYRKMTDRTDLNFVLTHLPYTSEKQLTKAYFIKWVDSLATARITGSGQKNDAKTALTIETLIPVQKTAIEIENHYAAYFRGAWKLADNSRGGHFLALLMPDEKTGNLYLAFGFFYAAGMEKRYLFKTMEALLYTIDHEGI